jgi:hypothetical protein
MNNMKDVNWKVDWMQDIPKGTFILFSSGEYSDYGVYGIAKAREDIKVGNLRDEYIELYPEQQFEYKFKESEFWGFLKSKGLVELIPYKEWYLGTYSKISSMDVTDGSSRWGAFE